VIAAILCGWRITSVIRRMVVDMFTENNFRGRPGSVNSWWIYVWREQVTRTRSVIWNMVSGGERHVQTMFSSKPCGEEAPAVSGPWVKMPKKGRKGTLN